jgi:hypothetical protein
MFIQVHMGGKLTILAPSTRPALRACFFSRTKANAFSAATLLYTCHWLIDRERCSCLNTKKIGHDTALLFHPCICIAASPSFS